MRLLGQEEGKSAPGLCSAGLCLVAHEDVDHHDQRLRSWVDGEPRKDSNTADTVFDVERLACGLSQYLTLELGDLILTGGPQGITLPRRFDYLASREVVEPEIRGLGRPETGERI